MFNKIINTVVYHAAFATSYSCHTSAKGLRVAADKLDVVGSRCASVAVTSGLKAGTITQEQVDAAKAKVNNK